MRSALIAIPLDLIYILARIFCCLTLVGGELYKNRSFHTLAIMAYAMGPCQCVYLVCSRIIFLVSSSVRFLTSFFMIWSVSPLCIPLRCQ